MRSSISVIFAIFFSMPMIALASSNRCVDFFTESHFNFQKSLAKTELIFTKHVSDQEANSSAEYRESLGPLSHRKILEHTFGIKFGRNGKSISIGQIFEIYENEMRQFVRSGLLVAEDILHPRFIFRLSDQRLIGISPGDGVPQGAVPAESLLKLEEFQLLVAQGIFPIGNFELTPTKITSFEHDLSHLTAFIASPGYMKALKKGLVRPLDPKEKHLLGFNKSFDYFLAEGLFDLTDFAKVNIPTILNWPADFSKYGALTNVKDVEIFLNSKKQEDLQTHFVRLESFVRANLVDLGGASREPNILKINYFHNRIEAMLEDVMTQTTEGTSINVRALARLEVFLYYLKDIGIEDWFVSRDDQSSFARVKLHRLFVDSQIYAYSSALDSYASPQFGPNALFKSYYAHFEGR